MIVSFHKSFRKGLVRLTPQQKKRIGEVLEAFEQNPHDPQLENHVLHGDLKERRAISAGGDLRLIFEERNNYQHVVFYRVGTHNQVY